MINNLCHEPATKYSERIEKDTLMRSRDVLTAKGGVIDYTKNRYRRIQRDHEFMRYYGSARLMDLLIRYYGARQS